MRVTSEKQTLILAGEPEPRRSAYAATSQQPLTLIATPVDEPVLLGKSGAEDFSPYAITPVPRNVVPSAGFAERGSGYYAANAYARTQQLLGTSTRSALIDAYA